MNDTKTLVDGTVIRMDGWDKFIAELGAKIDARREEANRIDAETFAK